MLVVATYMDDDGTAWPSQDTIARGGRSTTRTVREHVTLARALGWLYVATEQQPGRAWRRTIYYATVPEHVLERMTDVDLELTDVREMQGGHVDD